MSNAPSTSTAVASAATVSALLLLAVAGGFSFAYFCRITRFAFLRMEGQQLYLASAVAAVVLLVISRSVGLIASAVSPWFCAPPAAICVLQVLQIRTVWVDFVGLAGMSNVLAVFGGAFLLGPVFAFLINILFSKEAVSKWALYRYGSELEKFAQKSWKQKLPVLVTLDNRKVYVGWVGDAPVVEPKKYVEEYLKLLPKQSGYRDDEDLRIHFTTSFEEVLRQISDDARYEYKMTDEGDVRLLTAEEFAIVIPVDRIVALSWHAVGFTDPPLTAEDFETSKDEEEARAKGEGAQKDSSRKARRRVRESSQEPSEGSQRGAGTERD